MNLINELKSFGFQINWTLLSIGYHGYSFIPVLLKKQSLRDYALEILETMNANYELVAQIASVSDGDYEFDENLNKLVRRENVDFNLQVRKWRALLLNHQIKELPQDCFEALISLTEFWVSLGLPDDCPHIIQGRNNSYSPQEYYTNNTYKLVLEKNVKWLKHEISTIIFLESCSKIQ